MGIFDKKEGEKGAESATPDVKADVKTDAKSDKKSDSKSTDVGMDVKGVLKKAGQEKRKIFRNDRVSLKIVKSTKHYKEGQIITPHRVMAEDLIRNKIAVEYTAPKEEKVEETED